MMCVTRSHDRAGASGTPMQRLDGDLVFSPSDLVGSLSCGHLPALELAALAGLVKRPMQDEEEMEVVRLRGLEHERRYLSDLFAVIDDPVQSMDPSRVDGLARVPARDRRDAQGRPRGRRRLPRGQQGPQGGMTMEPKRVVRSVGKLSGWLRTRP